MSDKRSFCWRSCCCWLSSCFAVSVCRGVVVPAGCVGVHGDCVTSLPPLSCISAGIQCVAYHCICLAIASFFFTASCKTLNALRIAAPPRLCEYFLEGGAGARDVQVIPAGRPVDGGPWVVESGGVTGLYGVFIELFCSLFTFPYTALCVLYAALCIAPPWPLWVFFRRVGLVAGVCKSYRQVGPWTAVLG